MIDVSPNTDRRIIGFAPSQDVGFDSFGKLEPDPVAAALVFYDGSNRSSVTHVGGVISRVESTGGGRDLGMHLTSFANVTYDAAGGWFVSSGANMIASGVSFPTNVWCVVGLRNGVVVYKTNSFVYNALGATGSRAGAFTYVGQFVTFMMLPGDSSDRMLDAAIALMFKKGCDGTATLGYTSAFRSRAEIDIVRNCTLYMSAALATFSGSSNISSFCRIPNTSIFNLGSIFSTVNFRSFGGGNFNSVSSGVTSFLTGKTNLVELGQITFSNAQSFQNGFLNCSSLINFPGMVFDVWTGGGVVQTNCFLGAWAGCTSLSYGSVERILSSIDRSGRWATTTGTSGGTPLAGDEITIDYNTATGFPDIAIAVANLKVKSWNIRLNGFLQ